LKITFPKEKFKHAKSSFKLIENVFEIDFSKENSRRLPKRISESAQVETLLRLADKTCPSAGRARFQAT